MARPLAHTIGAPVALSMVAATLAVAFMMRHGPADDPRSALRVGAMLIAFGCSFIFDDLATEISSPSPTRLLVRRAERIAVGVAPMLVCWLALARFAQIRSGATVPLAASLVELVAMSALTLSVTAAAGRLATDGRGAIAGAPALFAALVIGQVLPRWQFVFVVDSLRDPSARRVAALIAVCVGVGIAASRDTAARRPFARIRARSTNP